MQVRGHDGDEIVTPQAGDLEILERDQHSLFTMTHLLWNYVLAMKS